MFLFECILGISATIISFASSYGAYNDYLINKERYIKEIISESVEHSYLTYVKQQKQIYWSCQEKKIAEKYAMNYFKKNSIHKLDDHKLIRLIKYKLLELKSLKNSAISTTTVISSEE